MKNKVRDLFLKQNREDKNFLGGVPFSEDIERALQNYNLYQKEGLPNRARVNLGLPYLVENEVVGYTSFTVLRNANPTQYEKEFIGLAGKLNYLQFKGLLVHPEFRNQGIGFELGKIRRSIASGLDLSCICDLKASNIRNRNLLEKQGFEESFTWLTPNGSEMLRYRKD